MVEPMEETVLDRKLEIAFWIFVVCSMMRLLVSIRSMILWTVALMPVVTVQRVAFQSYSPV